MMVEVLIGEMVGRTEAARQINQAKGPRLSEERQVSMVITRGLQSRKLAASAMWNENDQAVPYS